MKRKVLLVLFGFIIGIIVSGTCVYAATLYEATEVAYDNSSSGTSNVNVQTALDELYKKAEELTNKNLKYELIVSNKNGGSMNINKTLERDYLLVFIVGGVGRPDTEGQTISFGGTASISYIDNNSNWTNNSSKYRCSLGVYINPKKGQTITSTSTWTNFMYAVGVYEE